MDISIRLPRFYVTNFISNHIKKTYCEVISKLTLIIFAPEEAEIFNNYLFILARFTLDCIYFLVISRDVLFSDVKFAIYLNNKKNGKIDICVYITRKQTMRVLK